MLHKLNGILLNLRIDSKRMKKNLELTRGLVYSQRLLLALTEKLPAREEAYKIVQSLAMKSWDEKLDFRKLVSESPEVSRHLNPKEIDSLFDITYYTRRAKEIIERAIA